jgi:quercetin dioxygenase-like cupin family protein
MPKLTGFSSLAALPVEQIGDKVSRRLVAGDQAMVVWWQFKAGAHVTAHSHPHEQIISMVSGKLDVRIGTERRMMVPGDIAVIPGGVEHEVLVVEDTEVIDTFAPPREEFLTSDLPSYMKA